MGATLGRCQRIAKATLQTCGNVICITILLSTALTTHLLSCGARKIVNAIAWLTNARIEQDGMLPHRERYLSFQLPFKGDDDPKQPNPLCAYREGSGGKGKPNEEPMQVLDEAETLARVMHNESSLRVDNSKLPAHFGNEAALTALAHKFISTEFGCLDTDLLADDFQFVFPVVGPLTKAEFVEAFTSFEVSKAFPNSRANFYNFKIDPLEPNRLWALSRGCFVQEGTLKFGPSVFPPPETPKKVCLPPQCFSFSFDDSGRVYKLTGGYCVDRACGDTGGLGGLFGMLQGLGGKAANALPFTEGRPWNKDTRSLAWEAMSLRVPQMIKDWKKALAPVSRTSGNDLSNSLM